MARFNTKSTKSTGLSPVKATVKTKTYEGGEGYLRDARSELFLLAIVNFHGQNTFYEKANDRDARYRELVRKLAVEDPEWTVKLLTWLRGPEGNIRTAALVGAAEFVKARLDAIESTRDYEGKARIVDHYNRQVIRAVLQRADEPGELLAYWTANYGRRIPKPIKRGVADAVKRLYTEYALLKYDTASHGWRFGDVIEMVHPKPDASKPWQGDLFQYAIERRQKRDNPVPDSLEIIRANDFMRRGSKGDPTAWLKPDLLKKSGMTWEDALSAVGSKVNKGKLWEAMIPNMGYMALIRNLRNFDEAKVSTKIAQTVIDRIQDPEQVAKSRQFPFRFYSAYKAAPSLRWGSALDTALSLSMQNLPEFKGKTLILVDTSASMTGTSYSEKSQMRYVDSAALFGIALALRNPGATLRGFANSEFTHQVRKGGSVLLEMDRFTRRIGEVGHGTDIQGAVRRSLAQAKYDRIVILTDMQTFGGYWTGNVSDAAPKNVPIYAFNLAGYRQSAIPSGTSGRYEMGGVTDATFKMIPLLEAGKNCDWPWVG